MKIMEKAISPVSDFRPAVGGGLQRFPRSRRRQQLQGRRTADLHPACGGGSAQRLRLRPERQPDQRHDGRGDGQRRVEHLVGQCFPQYRQRRVELHEQSVRQVVVGLHGHRLLQPVFR